MKNTLLWGHLGAQNNGICCSNGTYYPFTKKNGGTSFKNLLLLI